MKHCGQIGAVGSLDAAFALERLRDDRRIVAIAEPRARPKAERFYRPLRDGRAF